MRCERCHRAWPDNLHVTDFGNGLIVECKPAMVEIRFVDFADHPPRVLTRGEVSRDELQHALDSAYGRSA